MIGEVIAGRYELEALVGSGGMSSVYRAHDRLLDRRVALKILHEHYANDEEYVERFRREARAVAQLSHPHIVTVIDRGADDGRQFIVFEFVEGENLKQLVERDGRLPVRRALWLAITVADALAFAHAHGLVHRDVKPQNVLLDAEGEVKVTDFGIARSLGVDRSVTQTGTVLGTSTYISPEQASGKPVTAATDVYALGVVLWELLTGEVPFPGDNFVAVALRHINEPPPSLLEARPDAPPRLAAAIERALAKDPARRFRSMTDFAAELRTCLAELGSDDPEQTLVSVPSAASRPKTPARTRTPRRSQRRSWRRSWRRALAAVLVAAAAIAAVVTGVLALGGSGTSPRHGASGGTGTPVALRGVTDYDPQGNGHEHAETASAATDGNPATSWYTETYASANFGGLKDGVGLVLDAGSATALDSLTVTTDTPGFRATVLAGDSASGPFAPDTDSRTVGARTTFMLRGAAARFYVLWITQLPPGGKAEIAEVTAAR